jgi:hypothetical protein
LNKCLQKFVIKKKKETIQQTKRTSSAAIQNVPVPPFADYTNFHMFLRQQQYPAAQLFMNPMNSLIFNKDKDNVEDKEVIKLLFLKQNCCKKIFRK